ncbi:hypothetical protein B0H13DRAFT_2579139 [Mycena leptocephala]|nr:hypothetical protein B0H13DRAFT_2579139 [Mycena leptocephala]
MARSMRIALRFSAQVLVTSPATGRLKKRIAPSRLIGFVDLLGVEGQSRRDISISRIPGSLSGSLPSRCASTTQTVEDRAVQRSCRDQARESALSPGCLAIVTRMSFILTGLFHSSNATGITSPTTSLLRLSSCEIAKPFRSAFSVLRTAPLCAVLPITISPPRPLRVRAVAGAKYFWLVLGSLRGAEPRTSVLLFSGGNAHPRALLPIVCYTAACSPAPLGPSACVPAPLADSCRDQRRRLMERDHRQGVHSALSIYDADANAHLSVLRASRKSWSWGWGWGWRWSGARRWSTGIEVENENEMEMATAHSCISVEMEMQKCGGAYSADTALSRERERRRGRGRRGRAQWTSRQVPVRAQGTRASFLAAYAPAFLARARLTDARKPYMHTVGMTLGADVRARPSVEVGMCVLHTLAVERRRARGLRRQCCTRMLRDGEVGTWL